MSDETSTQVDARIEGTRIKGYAVHGGYFDVPLFTQITDELWVGGTPAENLECLWEWDDEDEMTEPRFDAILCLYPWEPYSVPEGVIKREVALYDALEQALDQVDELADQIDSWIASSGAGSVLVHCQAGLNRSNLVVARYLIKHKGMTPNEAISLLREKRHQEVLCNSHFESWLRRE
jgi:hypothetical protein